MGGSGKGSGKQLVVAMQEPQARLRPDSPRRQSLAQPDARSRCRLPAAPTPRQTPTHGKPPGPRRPQAAAAAGAGWLPAALSGRAIAVSSALQERSARRHHPVVPGASCAGAPRGRGCCPLAPGLGAAAAGPSGTFSYGLSSSSGTVDEGPVANFRSAYTTLWAMSRAAPMALRALLCFE